MARQLIRIGVRKFREGLSTFLESPDLLAITRHGQTIGYYVPTRGAAEEAELAALRRAVAELETPLAEHGVSEDEVVREFRARRGQS